MTQRLIRIEYSGGANYKLARAATMEGALRAAMLRIAKREYSEAMVYDDRFVQQTTCSLRVTRHAGGLNVHWPKTPKWKEKV